MVRQLIPLVEPLLALVVVRQLIPLVEPLLALFVAHQLIPIVEPLVDPHVQQLYQERPFSS